MARVTLSTLVKDVIKQSGYKGSKRKEYNRINTLAIALFDAINAHILAGDDITLKNYFKIRVVHAKARTIILKGRPVNAPPTKKIRMKAAGTLLKKLTE